MSTIMINISAVVAFVSYYNDHVTVIHGENNYNVVADCDGEEEAKGGDAVSVC